VSLVGEAGCIYTVTKKELWDLWIKTRMHMHILEIVGIIHPFCTKNKNNIFLVSFNMLYDTKPYAIPGSSSWKTKKLVPQDTIIGTRVPDRYPDTGTRVQLYLGSSPLTSTIVPGRKPWHALGNYAYYANLHTIVLEGNCLIRYPGTYNCILGYEFFRFPTRTTRLA